MKRKGQAAMEFLMTYGWAILAAIIVIGVLAVYFRPSQLTSNSVVVTAPFYGLGVTLSATQIQVEVQNNGGESINLDDAAPATITFNTPSGAACTASAADTDPIPAGQTSIITFSGAPDCTGLTSGDNVNADVAITYRRPDGNLDLTSTGTVSGTVP
jgi:hypothetical protein